MDIRFLGHACFELSDGSNRVLIDPFLSGNPKAAVSAEEVNPTTILLTHGHADHIGDTVDIAKRTGAPVVAIVELANEIGEEGIEVHDPNLGGTVKFDWGWVKLVPAWHTSTTPKGTVHTPTGMAINSGVAILRLREHEQLARVVTGAISQLSGVVRTQTMVAFEAYSRHDLEALFSIGQ